MTTREVFSPSISSSQRQWQPKSYRNFNLSCTQCVKTYFNQKWEYQWLTWYVQMVVDRSLLTIWFDVILEIQKKHIPLSTNEDFKDSNAMRVGFLRLKCAVWFWIQFQNRSQLKCHCRCLRSLFVCLVFVNT